MSTTLKAGDSSRMTMMKVEDHEDNAEGRVGTPLLPPPMAKANTDDDEGR